MNNKYILSFCTPIALSGTQSWSAAENDPLEKNRGRLELLPKRSSPKEIIERLDPSALVNLAIAFPDLYQMVKEMPLFQLLKYRIERHGGDLWRTLFMAIVNDYPGAIDVIRYLAQHTNISALYYDGYYHSYRP